MPGRTVRQIHFSSHFQSSQSGQVSSLLSETCIHLLFPRRKALQFPSLSTPRHLHPMQALPLFSMETSGIPPQIRAAIRDAASPLHNQKSSIPSLSGYSPRCGYSDRFALRRFLGSSSAKSPSGKSRRSQVKTVLRFHALYSLLLHYSPAAFPSSAAWKYSNPPHETSSHFL